jgi:hypothetical protein
MASIPECDALIRNSAKTAFVAGSFNGRSKRNTRVAVPSRILSLDDEWDRAPNVHDHLKGGFGRCRQRDDVERCSLTKRRGSRSASGTYFDWRCAPRTRPHQVLFLSSLKGRRAQEFFCALVRLSQVFLPSLLAGDGPGVRWHFTRGSHRALSTQSPSICRRKSRIPSRLGVSSRVKRIRTPRISGRRRLDLNDSRICAHNEARRERNTVQPQAVNLAYAEPCPDEKSRHGSFYLRAVFARNARRWQGRAGHPQISRVAGNGERRLSHEIRFDTTQSDRGRSKWLRDFTRERHRVQGQGPASKVRTGFEGAHCF